MKHYILPVLLVAGLFMNTGTQAQNYYTVEIGTFIGAKLSDFDAVRQLGFVHADKLGANDYTVFLGGFNSSQAAQKVAEQVTRLGYMNARVKAYQSDGRTVAIIQIASLDPTDPVDWETYLKAGDLYALLEDNSLKLAVGVYGNVNEAKNDLPKVRSAGFSDAFIKRVGIERLHKITSFEMGGLKQPLIPLKLDKKQPSTENKQEPAKAQEVLMAKGTQPEAQPKPDVRSDVKRNSVVELQKVLKAEGVYNNAIDGYYGPGTKAGYDQFISGSRDMTKYAILAKNLDYRVETGPNDDLQKAINQLLTNPGGVSTLSGSSNPIAFAYRAYYQFVSRGPSNEVNNLMNQAIKKAYAGKDSEAPFDYNAYYAYPDLEQLILHMLYIHSAPGIRYAVPCWMFTRHAEETAHAQTNFTDYAKDDFHVESCDPFVDWEEVRMMLAVAQDLSGRTAAVSPDQMAMNASRRAKLSLVTKPLSNEKLFASAKEWNDQLLSGLDAWAGRDPLHVALELEFKITYFKSQVLLEDYYMNKGYNQQDATKLALATLHTLVSDQLDRFT